MDYGDNEDDNDDDDVDDNNDDVVEEDDDVEHNDDDDYDNNDDPGYNDDYDASDVEQMRVITLQKKQKASFVNVLFQFFLFIYLSIYSFIYQEAESNLF